MLSCTGDKNPDCIQYPQTKQGMLRLIFDADVLYVRLMNYFERVALWRLPRLFSLPVIWEINAPLEEQYAVSATALENEAKMKRHNQQRYFNAKFVDAAVCVSKANAVYAADFLRIKNTYVVPNASDPDLFGSGNGPDRYKRKSSDEFIVLWAGNPQLAWQAMGLMFDTAKRIAELDAQIRFVFISAQDTDVFPKQDNVEVISAVGYNDMPRYILSADVCLALYNNYTWCPYGFYHSPLKLFDYMAAGKAVIASGLGQISEVISHGRNGFLTDNRVDDVVRLIMECKRNPQRCVQIGSAAREEALRYYNWDRVAAEVEDVLKRTKKVA